MPAREARSVRHATRIKVGVKMGHMKCDQSSVVALQRNLKFTQPELSWVGTTLSRPRANFEAQRHLKMNAKDLSNAI